MCNARLALKYLYTFVFWLSGATLIGVGTYVTIDVINYIDLIGKQWIAVALAYIGVGGLVFLSSLIGGVSVSSDYRIWVNIFTVLLWIAMLLEIAGAIISVIYQDNIADRTGKQLNATISSYHYGGADDVTKQWDAMQTSVQCCGATDYTDWFAIGPALVPSSCCIGNAICSVNNETNTPSNQIYTNGCNHEVTDLLELYATIVWSSGFCAAFVSMLGILIFCILRSKSCSNCCTAKAVDRSATIA